jgi:hypothetical protein
MDITYDDEKHLEMTIQKHSGDHDTIFKFKHF